MGGQVFQITWNGNSIVYDPLAGSIQNVSTKELTIIEKNPQSQFPDFAGVTSSLLPEKYKPFCLTIYPNHRCNLACRYCYVSDKANLPSDDINPLATRAGAEIIAVNCLEKGTPFILGFHGGSEPLLRPELINDCITICRKAAKQNGLEVMAFCTTGGVVSEQIARWTAQTFHGITLSWDGPPDIHDRFRLQINGTPTSSIVRRTAEIFMGESSRLQQFKVRATITSTSVGRLHDIVQYFHEQRVKCVEVYPVFQDAVKSLPVELIPQASDFVGNFLMARKWAKQHDMTLGYAGSRLADFHDRYCPVYQNNLTITPDGYLTACFQASHDRNDQNHHYMYGHLDQGCGKFIIDWKKLESILGKLAQPYEQCANCFNYWHCARSCPAVCPIQNGFGTLNHFICTNEKWIGLANLLEAAGYEIADEDLENCEAFFSNLAVEVLPSAML